MHESFPVMAWRSRPDMSCEYLSPRWLAFTGYEREAALGDGWSRGVHPEDLARWLDTCLRAYDARQPYEIEYRLRRRDGEYRWVLDRAEPRFDEAGVFAGYSGVSVDIDEHKRAESELARALERERRLRIATEEASRLRDGFLATVMQDVQAPAQAIAAWARHLRERVMRDSEASRALDAIQRNAEAQDRIIGDLLDLARAAGRAPVLRSATDEPLLAGVRVLLVEDDPGARDAMLKILSIAGAEAKSAASGSEALQALRAWRPDVLLSDLAVKGGDALSLIRALRSLPAEQGGCLRAAAITAPARPQEGLRAVAAGYDAQLAKPVEPVALLATLTRLVRTSAL